MTKQNLPNITHDNPPRPKPEFNFIQEQKHYDFLYAKSDRSNTGQEVFTNTATGATYNTALYADTDINDCGETGLMNLLARYVLNNYLITAEDFNKLLDKTGDTLEGDIDAGGNKITNLPTPLTNGESATKGYVDTLYNTPKNWTAGDYTIFLDTSTATISSSSASYDSGLVKKKEYKVANSGVLKVSFDLIAYRSSMNTSNRLEAYALIYINDSAIGTERMVELSGDNSNGGVKTESFTENITVFKGDKIQIKLRLRVLSGTNTNKAEVQNVRFSIDNNNDIIVGGNI